MAQSKIVKVKINTVPGFAVDSVIDIEVDAGGIPLERFWRKRFRDAKVEKHKCCEIISEAEFQKLVKAKRKKAEPEKEKSAASAEDK